MHSTIEKYTDTQRIELSFIDIGKWQDTPAPEREWTVQGRVPLGAATICAGEGGIGKTLLMLHCGAAVALAQVGAAELTARPSANPKEFRTKKNSLWCGMNLAGL